MRAVILGMGNTLLSDDGIGIILKRHLEKILGRQTDIEFCETSWGGFRIIDLLQGYDYAVIIDSIKTGSKPAGFIHLMKPSDFLPTLRLTSYHDINFITAVKLAESLNTKMPKNIDIIAVEIENNNTIAEKIDESLIPSMNNALDFIIKLLIENKMLHAEFTVDEKINSNLLENLYAENL